MTEESKQPGAETQRRALQVLLGFLDQPYGNFCIPAALKRDCFGIKLKKSGAVMMGTSCELYGTTHCHTDLLCRSGPGRRDYRPAAERFFSNR